MTRYPPRKPSLRAIRDLHETYARTATPSAGRQAAADAARDAALEEAAAFVDGVLAEFQRVFDLRATIVDREMMPATIALFAYIADGIRARRSEGGR